jgi:DNA-binding NtrC family response regulator
MTAEMAFECLLVSQDADVLCAMNRALEELSIYTTVCMTPVRALELLPERNHDLIVIDWQNEQDAAELLREIWNGKRRKPTVVAISSEGRAIAGAHMVLPRPLTSEFATKSLRVAYSSMVQDYRRYARYAVMNSLVATDQDNREVPLAITDISQGGVGFRTKEELAIGDVMTFNLQLQRARKAIHIQARVLWTGAYGSVGCEFVRIPPVDLDVLHEWLRSKCQIKKPLVM